MSSRKLIDLSIPMFACCTEFELLLAGKGIPYVRACTYRSHHEQEALYAQGRTTPGRIVTHARGGQSPHNDTIKPELMRVTSKYERLPAANAADYYPLQNGKLLDDKTDAELALWEKIGQIGEACGLDWGGRWKHPKTDKPHFQMKGWKRNE